MRPSPSLHYVSTLLDHRRRRYHRARWLWGTGLLLLGLGLFLVGWWGTLRRSPSATPQAAAISLAERPAWPSGPPGMRRMAIEPHWGRPVLLEPAGGQDCACPTWAPWRAACTPGSDDVAGCPTLPGGTPAPAPRPWEP